MVDRAFDVVVIGSLNTDFSFRVRRFPGPGETLLSTGMLTSAGGKGGNQAVACARMGARAAMMAIVGDDERGDALVRFLDKHGVDTHCVIRRPDVQTGLAAIFVNDEGENLIVVDQGANAVAEEHWAIGALPHAAYLLAQLETPLPAIRSAFEQARRRGIRCALNAAPADPKARVLFRLCDTIIINEPELAIYADLAVDPNDANTIARAAKSLMTHDEQTVIVTRGRRGALAVRRGAQLLIEAHTSEAADTTGAGDCFCGTLVAAMASGLALGAAINRANAAAALAVRRSGAAEALPSAEEVDALLAKANEGRAILRH